MESGKGVHPACGTCMGRGVPRGLGKGPAQKNRAQERRSCAFVMWPSFREGKKAGIRLLADLAGDG